jgi:hypothetical protein
LLSCCHHVDFGGAVDIVDIIYIVDISRCSINNQVIIALDKSRI